MASFLLLSKAQLRVIQPLMEFPAKVLSVFYCPANNHQPLSLSWLKPLPGGNQNKAQGATRGSEGSTGTGVWVAVPRDGPRKGGRALRRPGESKLSETLCDSGPSQGGWRGGVGKRAKGWRGGERERLWTVKRE